MPPKKEGAPAGLRVKEKEAAARGYTPRRQKALGKAKPALPDKSARAAVRRRKSSGRLLCGKPVREALFHLNGAEKKRPANPKKRRVSAARPPPPAARSGRASGVNAGRPPPSSCGGGRTDFNATLEFAGKLKAISPASVDCNLKKGGESLTLKGKIPPTTTFARPLKGRVSVRAFYAAEERKTPGFRRIDMDGPLGSEVRPSPTTPISRPLTPS
ncbi:MAG: hypothetical protein LBG43_04145 [Treponema sp.]|jgi:hypothetical protein|nr:hypothetical protein [Treponema sp.]